MQWRNMCQCVESPTESSFESVSDFEQKTFGVTTESHLTATANINHSFLLLSSRSRKIFRHRRRNLSSSIPRMSSNFHLDAGKCAGSSNNKSDAKCGDVMTDGKLRSGFQHFFQVHIFSLCEHKTTRHATVRASFKVHARYHRAQLESAQSYLFAFRLNGDRSDNVTVINLTN